MHRRLMTALAVDAIKVCTAHARRRLRVPQAEAGHAPGGGRRVRDFALDRSFMVGDRAERCRRRTRGRLPDGLHRPGLRRAEARATPTSRSVSRGRGRRGDPRRIRTDGRQLCRVSMTSRSRFSPTAPTSTASSRCRKNPMIKGFTTNPTLMRKAGVTDYEAFAHQVLAADARPSGLVRGVRRRLRRDDRAGPRDRVLGTERQRQGPGDQHQGRVRGPGASRRCRPSGVILNVTAIMTLDQVRAVAEALDPDVAGHRLGVRRPHRRHRRRSGAAHDANA